MKKSINKKSDRDMRREMQKLAEDLYYHTDKYLGDTENMVGIEIIMNIPREEGAIASVKVKRAVTKITDSLVMMTKTESNKDACVD